jgi:Transglutaminase-like superfamily
VLERGTGTPAAITILYMEICRRLGFPLAARQLEGGKHFVLWPEHAVLGVEGLEYCIDAYSGGGLLHFREVSCQLWELVLWWEGGRDVDSGALNYGRALVARQEQILQL